MIQIRPAGHADASAWLRMREALWPGPDSSHATEIERYFTGRLSNPLEVLLAVDPERNVAVGFVELSIRNYAEDCLTDRVAYLEGWYVAPGWRGRGVGRRLVEASESWARAQGCTELASDAEIDNSGSIAVHRALGFAQTSRIQCFRKNVPDSGDSTDGRRHRAVAADADRPAVAIRTFEAADWPAVWNFIEPVFRAGETYPFAPDIPEAEARRAWVDQPRATYVAIDGGQIVGTYYLKPNQPGQGAHVCNCGFIVAAHARGRGLAAIMCEHSLAAARRMGFRAMQFNLVVSTNASAVRAWRRFGFDIVGRLPNAFKHPDRGYVDAFVMYKQLTQ